MKAYYRYVFVVIFLILGICIGSNLFLMSKYQNSGREYRIEIERAKKDILKEGYSRLDLSKYPSILCVIKAQKEETSFFEGENENYILRKINGEWYRFEYRVENRTIYRSFQYAMNFSFLFFTILILGILFFIRKNIILPFAKITTLPYELAKGNLSVPLKENKNKFFGKFIWGMDLLREKLEVQKQEELKLIKEKKTLILSLAHDIKTPLSAIKLSGKALARGLYKEENKKKEVLNNLDLRVNEIEDYLTKIVKASNEEFLCLEAENKEFYLKDLLEEIKTYYEEKLEHLKIEFSMEEYINCMLKGDIERAVEVVQNIIENAIKYGNGSPIQISTFEEENCKIISIANKNCKLSDHELSHVFDSFWRGSNATICKGNGLGLYICRQLMQKMNGDIYVTKENDKVSFCLVFQKYI